LLDIEKIRDLVEMMVKNDLVEISLRDGEEEVNLRRPNAASAFSTPDAAPPAGLTTLPPPAGSRLAPLPNVAASNSPAVELIEIKSPMVGTFYSAPDPESPPYLRVGQALHVGMVVCIVEAMKVFNEIKSEVAGTLERILVSNAQAVEFGQPLFQVRP